MPRDMISHSKKWAEARGLCFRSEVHGEDEWRIPVRREFEHKNVNRVTNTSQVEFVTQDPNFIWCKFFTSVSARFQTIVCANWKDTTGELMENPTDRNALMWLELLWKIHYVFWYAFMDQLFWCVKIWASGFQEWFWQWAWGHGASLDHAVFKFQAQHFAIFAGKRMPFQFLSCIWGYMLYSWRSLSRSQTCHLAIDVIVRSAPKFHWRCGQENFQSWRGWGPLDTSDYRLVLQHSCGTSHFSIWKQIAINDHFQELC